MEPPASVEDIRVGQEIVESYVFSPEDLTRFGALANDHAPVHRDADFARAHGYDDCLVYGFLVAARFSGLLGEQLPGPNTVLHSAKWQMVKPAYAGRPLTYRVAVKQIARAVRAVVLDLAVTDEDGEVLLRGSAQCGFREES